MLKKIGKNDLESRRRTAVLLHVAGEEAMEESGTELTDQQKKKLEIYKSLENYCTLWR